MEDEDDFDAPSSSAVERFRQRVKDATSEAPDDDDTDSDDAPTVEAANDSDDDEAVVVQTRKQKKQARLGLLEELKTLREERQAQAERLARLEGQQSALLTQRAAVDKTDERDPLEDEFEAVVNAHNDAWKVLQAKGANVTDADKEAYRKKVVQFERDKGIITARMANARDGITPTNPHEALQSILRAENPDIYGNQAAFNYARATFEQYRALGRPDNKATLEAAFSAAREAFKLAPPRGAPPSQARKRQFEGAPRGRSGAGAAAPEQGESITMTKELRSMARTAYPGLPEAKAYAKWAQTVGPAYLKAIKGDR